MQVIPLVVGAIALGHFVVAIFQKTQKYSAWIEEHVPGARTVINHPRFNTWLLIAFIAVYGVYAAENIHEWLAPRLTVRIDIPAPEYRPVDTIIIYPPPLQSQATKRDSGTPAIQQWSTKKLHDAVLDYAGKMRKFALDFQTSMDITINRESQDISSIPASDTATRERVRNAQDSSRIANYRNFTEQIMSGFYQSGQIYHDELVRRIGPEKPSLLTETGIFGGNRSTGMNTVIQPSSVLASATELENLANQLH